MLYPNLDRERQQAFFEEKAIFGKNRSPLEIFEKKPMAS
jgi:hypothetical protein